MTRTAPGTTAERGIVTHVAGRFSQPGSVLIAVWRSLGAAAA